MAAALDLAQGSVGRRCGTWGVPSALQEEFLNGFWNKALAFLWVIMLGGNPASLSGFGPSSVKCFHLLIYWYSSMFTLNFMDFNSSTMTFVTKWSIWWISQMKSFSLQNQWVLHLTQVKLVLAHCCMHQDNLCINTWNLCPSQIGLFGWMDWCPCVFVFFSEHVPISHSPSNGVFQSATYLRYTCTKLALKASTVLWRALLSLSLSPCWCSRGLSAGVMPSVLCMAASQSWFRETLESSHASTDTVPFAFFCLL